MGSDWGLEWLLGMTIENYRCGSVKSNIGLSVHIGAIGDDCYAPLVLLFFQKALHAS